MAIVLVSLVGTWRQGGYGNVRLRGALANAVSERVLELSFAGVQLLFAWQLAKKAGLR